MKRDIQVLIQKLIIVTSFPPLTYCYRKVYELSIAVAVLLFRRVDGVLAIYLRRGVAKSEVVYGLSDIDLSVIIDDENRAGQAVATAKERIASLHDRLTRFIPLFIRDEEELGIYAYSELLELYRDYDFHRYRFNEGKHTWKLLSGTDIIKDLPDLREEELYLPATRELIIWWLTLTRELDSTCEHPLFKRKYLWYKAIAEVSKVYLFICHGESIESREAALDRVKEHLSSQQRGCIEKVQNYIKRLTSTEDLILDEMVGLLITLIGKSVSEMERRVYEDTRVKKTVIESPDYHDLVLAPCIPGFIERIETHISEEIEPYLNYTAFIPQVEFSLDILVNTDIDSLDLVLGVKDSIPVDKLRRLHSFFEDDGLSQRIQPFITDGVVALSLAAERKERCIKSPNQCPPFFALLPDTSRGLPSVSDNVQCRQIQFAYPVEFYERTIPRRAVLIDRTISDPRIFRIKDLDVLRFFWAAARTKLLASSMDSDEVSIPITSQQILGRLVELYPGDASWLGALYSEYIREMRGEESGAYRYVSKSIEFLKGM